MKNEIEEISTKLNNNLDEIKKLNEELNNNIKDIKNLSNKIKEINIENNLSEAQINWTNSEIYKILNNGFNTGIKMLLPDYMENEVIKLKDALLNSGVQDTIKNTVTDILNAVKNNNNERFENVNEVKNTLESESFINSISNLLEKEIDSVKENNIINENTADRLKEEKDTIISKVEEGFDISFENQNKNFEKMEKYITNWKDAYNLQDFSKMQREYNKMTKIMNELMPIENTINEYRTIENLQTLIKNNNKNFDLSDDALELANKLIN